MTEFQTNKKSLSDFQIIETTPAPLDTGDILVKVDRFAFTANNITYGVAGDQIGYWQFFAPTNSNKQDWGILPVWGFADVVESKSNDIKVGERFYGYFPPATYLKMHPTKIKATIFIEGSVHRAELPDAYNMYRRVHNEPGYDSALDDMRALLFPLYVTSFSLWDALKERDWYGAEQVLILSASSKTSIGLGYALVADKDAPAQVGLTSKRNIKMVNSLGIYNQTTTYDALETVKNIPTAIVDMSGNSDVLSQLHQHLGDNMKHTLNVGITHWGAPRIKDGIIKERSEMFFAPGHIQKRFKEWGPQEFEKRSTTFLFETIQKSQSWLNLTKLDGLEGLARVYKDVCNGTVSPDAGLIVTM